MKTFKQCVDECKQICAERWGDDWNSTVYLSVSIEFNFFSSGHQEFEFGAYVNQCNYGNTKAPSTDELVVALRAKLLPANGVDNMPDAIEACESVAAASAARGM